MSARVPTPAPTLAAPAKSTGWSRLPEANQVALADAALREAVVAVADQADILADAIQAGHLADRGGIDALRLLSRLIRATGRETLLPAGHA